MRKYKTGTRWCFWRWSIVDAEYIRRLHLIKTPYFAICLHWIIKADPEPHLHDHPVTFLSIVLRGGYTEKRVTHWPSKVPFLKTIRWYNWIRACPEDRHTIVAVKPKTLTICFMGPKTREWGFHTPDGWVYWKDYNKAKYG